MAEITYQMVLSTLQTAGLLVGIFSYITTMRNARALTIEIDDLKNVRTLLTMVGGNILYNVIK